MPDETQAQAEQLEQRAAHNATVDAAHEARKQTRAPRTEHTAAAEAPQMEAQNRKPAPCPCQDSPVTLEQIDQRVAALARLVLVSIVAAGVVYLLNGRKEAIEE